MPTNPTIQPNFARLLSTLNQTGLQTESPATFDILSQLIKAMIQSQQVTAQSSFNGVVVSPTGALQGNGTTTNPLLVLVDGTTVQINGSDQLTATASSPFFLQQGFFQLQGTGPLSLAANTVFMTVAAVPGKVIIPLALWGTSNQNDNGNSNALWSGVSSIECAYALDGTNTLWTSNLGFTQNVVGTHNQTVSELRTVTRSDGSNKNRFINNALLIMTSNAAGLVSTSGKFISNTISFTLFYALGLATSI